MVMITYRVRVPISFLCIFWSFVPLGAQRQVIDATTGSGIPYATIVVVNSAVGTVADEAGQYELPIPQGADSIRISALGYRTQTYFTADLPSGKLPLSPMTYTLNAATVDATRFTRSRRYGSLPTNNKLVIQFIGHQRGAQIGRVFRLRRESLLKTARISVTENTFGTATCRLRFYPVLDDSISPIPLPAAEFLLEVTGTGTVVVDLTDPGLVYQGELLMVLELLEAPDRDGTIYMGGAVFQSPGYVRAQPGEAWRRMKSVPSLGVGFELEVVQ